MPILSIIIPVFNEEHYIEESLLSALADCHENTEIIIIDDGSTDNTASCVNRIISQVGDGVSIIFEKNVGKGVADARKYGTQLSSGKYITFLDGDDFVERGAYSKLIQEAERTDADIVCFENDELHGDNTKPSFFAPLSSDYSQQVRDCISLRTSPSLCTKLIRKSLFDTIIFPTGNLAEDWAISVQLFLQTKKIVVLNEVLYHYRIVPSSLSRNSLTKEICVTKAMEEKSNVNLICSILESKGLSEEYKEEIEYRKTNVKRILFPTLKNRQDYSLWRSTFSEINRSVFSNQIVRFEYLFKHLFALIGILHFIYPLLILKRKYYSK